MEFRAFGNTLLVAESKGGNDVGIIKLANIGKLKSGKVISVGAQAMYDVDLNPRPDIIKVDDEVVYIAANAMPFEFGDPSTVVVHVDDIVAVRE